MTINRSEKSGFFLSQNYSVIIQLFVNLGCKN